RLPVSRRSSCSASMEPERPSGADTISDSSPRAEDDRHFSRWAASLGRGRGSWVMRADRGDSPLSGGYGDHSVLSIIDGSLLSIRAWHEQAPQCPVAGASGSHPARGGPGASPCPRLPAGTASPELPRPGRGGSPGKRPCPQCSLSESLPAASSRRRG